MKSLYPFFLLLFCAGIMMQCKTTNHKPEYGQMIPELIMRPHLIGPEDEMGYISDQYQSLKSKLTANPEDAESRIQLAELFMTEARISGEHGHYYPAALQLIDQALALPLDNGHRYRALTDKASVMLSLHQFEEARRLGDEALKLNPHSSDIYGVLTDASVEMGELEQAIAYADQMVAIRPDLRSYSRVAYLRELHGQVDGAIEALKLAASAGYPGLEQTEWVRLTLGNLYARYGQPDSAMVQYRTALMHRPNYPFAIAAMATLHRSKDEYAMADSLNKLACQLIPEVGFFIDKATWLKEEGDMAAADSLTSAILEMLADDEAAGHVMNLEKARVLLDLKDDPAQALTLATMEWEKRKTNLEVNALMAEILIRQDRWDEARPYLETALRTGSNDPAWRMMEGCMKIRMGIEEGYQQIQSIISRYPYIKKEDCVPSPIML